MKLKVRWDALTVGTLVLFGALVGGPAALLALGWLGALLVCAAFAGGDSR